MLPGRLSLAASIVSVIQGATLVVGPGGQFQDVRQAVRAAAAGDTIEVHAGTYAGNIVLDKTLSVQGIGQPVLRGTGTGSVVTVLAPGCSLRGFHIQHSGPMLVYEDSGVLLKSDGNRIENNQLRDVLFGIYLFHSSHNTIADNLIYGRKELGSGERGGGIHIWYSADNVLDRNTITDMRDGMYLQNADRTVVRGNHVFNLRYGLHYMYSNDNIFEDNTFDHNVAGAAIMYSHNIQFRRNAFLHNRGFSSFGILFQDSLNCIAEQNFIVDNVVGIFMEALRDSRFERNLIASNDTSIEAFASSEQNEFTRNNFIGNLSPIMVVGRNSNIRWDNGSRGNYWSENRGYDLDGDGVGDVPFRIQNLFEHLEGNRPRLRLYLSSPAAQALAAAEHSFPLIQGSREFDHYPLMKPVDLGVKVPETRASRHTPPGLPLVPASLIAAAAFAMWKGRVVPREREKQQ
jgi:nitrous oxidase accessory protein